MICPHCWKETDDPLTTQVGGKPLVLAPPTEMKIGFSTPKHFNPVSWLVRKLTGSTASHAFFIYHDLDWDEDWVMEAHELGFRDEPLRLFEKKNEIVASFVPKQSIAVGMRYVAKNYIGTAYDFGGLLGSAFLLLGRWLKRKWHNPLNSSKSVFCSEAVVIALQKSDYPGADGLVAYDTTPQDLLNFFKGS